MMSSKKYSLEKMRGERILISFLALVFIMTIDRLLRYGGYARMKEFARRYAYVPFRRFLGDGRRGFMQLISVVLHGMLDSYLRDALHEGGAADVACLPAPRA
jgi:hypothetical protein